MCRYRLISRPKKQKRKMHVEKQKLLPGFEIYFTDMLCFTFPHLNEMLKVYRRNINSSFMEMLRKHSLYSRVHVNRSVRFIVHFK